MKPDDDQKGVDNEEPVPFAEYWWFRIGRLTELCRLGCHLRWLIRFIAREDKRTVLPFVSRLFLR